MDQQQITPEDGCGYIIGIPSGQILRDAPAFFLRGSWHFVADGGGEQVIPAQLSNYAVRRKIEGVRIVPAGPEARLGSWVKPDYLENGGDKGLENGATYVVEFPFTNDGPHPDVARMFALHEKSFWYSFSDDATISVEDADYRVIRKVDPWAA